MTGNPSRVGRPAAGITTSSMVGRRRIPARAPPGSSGLPYPPERGYAGL